MAPAADEISALPGQPALVRPAAQASDPAAVAALDTEEGGQLLAALFDGSPTPQMLIGLGGSLIRVNPALCTMVGYTAEELAGLNMRSLNDPADHDQMGREMAGLWRGETEAIRREKRYLTKDGSVRWGDLTATRVTNVSEGTSYIQAVIVDTTERHRADAARLNSEERYRDLVEKLPGYAYRSTTDEMGSSLYISPQVKDLFGFDASQYLADPDFWANTIHPEDKGHVLAEFAQNVRSDAGFRVEYRIYDVLGRIRWVLDHGIVVHPGDDQPAYIQGIVLDITESKHAEAAQAESAAKSRIVAAMVRIGGLKTLAEVGKATVEQARDLLQSDSATVTWFDPRDDQLRAIAHTDADSGLPESRHTHEGAMGEAFRSGSPVVVLDYPNWPSALQTDNLRIPASVMAIPLLVHDRITGALSVACQSRRNFSDEDVSTLSLLGAHAAPALELALLLEQFRKTNAELEAASRHKSEFLAAMSHELRTPLNSILGFSQLLILGRRGHLQEEQRRYVDNIQTSGHHLLSLIDGVLDLSKVEAGRIELKSEATSLQKVLEVAIANMGPLAATKHLQLTLECDPQIRLVVDPVRLTQIVLNLTSNAIKFTNEGAVRVSACASLDSVVITVADTGIGIAEDQLDRIFEAFVQVDSGRSRNQSGTGLGLALTKHLVELMEGRIEVQSVAGHGSIFTVTLPVNQTAAQPKQAGSSAAESALSITSVERTGSKPLSTQFEQIPSSGDSD